ncbi:MAG: flavin reductase [Clostridia bacterium]|nr:flavin reductase [Clostridia bacterium]
MITKDIRYVGVNDHEIDLFEGQYVVPNGMAYNSYVILDQMSTVMDTVDLRFGKRWLSNIDRVMDGKHPDFLVVQHMEPDHSGSIALFMETYPEAVLVASSKALVMLKQFFGKDWVGRTMAVGEGDILTLGKHTLHFVTAPMVHWPEVLVTYDSTDKVLFSADGFGKFGALDADEDWACEARRYYFGIVGKYGAQVQALLKKAATLDIRTICPLHGPILKENLGYYLGLYNTWSSYEAESEGIMIAYTSVYGNTKKAVEELAESLRQKGAPKVTVCDLARSDMAEAVEDAFRYNKLVLATTTYNAEIFPHMHSFIHHLVERNYQNRTVAFIQNGTWAPLATKVMKKMLENCKRINYCETEVTIRSALNEESQKQLEDLANELCHEYIEMASETANKSDLTALFNIGYGLYVVSCNAEGQDNALIVNTVCQLTNNPNRIAVTINKDSLSHDLILKSGMMNVNCLTVDAPWSLFERFGMRSGRDGQKFTEEELALRSDNGLVFLGRHVNSLISLKVERYEDFGTHGMFICSITEARVFEKAPSLTYSYYQANIKPKPQATEKKGFACKVCGWVYEGDVLPEDLVCPLCKHGAADFEPLK